MLTSYSTASLIFIPMLLTFFLIHAHKNEKEKRLYTKNRVRFVFRIQSNTKFSSQEVVYFMVQI